MQSNEKIIKVEMPFANITVYVDINKQIESGALRFADFDQLPQHTMEVADATTAESVMVAVRVDITKRESLVVPVANDLLTNKIISILTENDLLVAQHGQYVGRTDWFGQVGPYESANLTSTQDAFMAISITINGVEIRSVMENNQHNQHVLQPMLVSPQYSASPWYSPEIIKGYFTFDGVEHSFTIHNRNYPLKNLMTNDDIVNSIYHQVYKFFPFAEKHNLLMNVRLD